VHNAHLPDDEGDVRSTDGNGKVTIAAPSKAAKAAHKDCGTCRALGRVK
jgi:hypothetical protein